ncbi:hypothetical protein ABZT51_47350 [Streptomyces sp. NPDC005373]|uniref:hypothetical protein n=1 Tax=Streptomyces sp. NPDC005373 TaxID=3156879 RepID=UPI0033B190AE
MLTPSVSDVVRYAGGWLFDQVLGGWDATVFAAERDDSRPLRILGADRGDLESVLTAPVRAPGRLAIAVDIGLYERDERVRRMVIDARECALADVRFWGEAWPAGLGDGAGEAPHRLSVAARAFKHRALVATGGTAQTIDATEVFRRGGTLHRPGTSARTESLTA